MQTSRQTIDNNQHLMLLIDIESSIKTITEFIEQHPDIDFNYVNDLGNTYLHQCLRLDDEVYSHRRTHNPQNRFLALIPLLAGDKGINLNAKNNAGMTILEVLVKKFRYRSPETSILMLLYHGAQLSSASNPELLESQIKSVLTQTTISDAILEIIEEQKQETSLQEYKKVTIKPHYPTIAELLPLLTSSSHSEKLPSPTRQAPHASQFSAPPKKSVEKPVSPNRCDTLLGLFISLHLLPEELKGMMSIDDSLNILGKSSIIFAKSVSLESIKTIADKLDRQGLKCKVEVGLTQTSIQIFQKIDALSQFLAEQQLRQETQLKLGK